VGGIGGRISGRTITNRGQSYRLREKRKAGIFTELTDLQKEA